MKSHLILLVLHFVPAFSSDVRWTANIESQAKLDCRHNLSKTDIITWHVNNTQIAYEEQIGHTKKILPGYRLEKEKGIVYLIIEKTEKQHAANFTCYVFYKDNINDYKTIKGVLQLNDFSDAVKSSLAALLFGCVLYVLLAEL